MPYHIDASQVIYSQPCYSLTAFHIITFIWRFTACPKLTVLKTHWSIICGYFSVCRKSPNDIIFQSQFLSFIHIHFYFTGNNSCWNQTLCEHLCFALDETEYRCECATGFVPNPKDNRTCLGAKSFLLFSTTTGKNIILIKNLFS